MEFVKVVFPGERDVIIDGQLSGKTNTILLVGLGHHVFTLGGDPHYTPPAVNQLVSGTSIEFPMIIRFEAA